MKALLMHADRDFDPKRPLPAHEPDHFRDLALETLLHVMAGGDDFIFATARAALFLGLENDIATILYRQEVVRDCIHNPEAVRQIYRLAVDAIESRKKSYFDIFMKYPGSVLSSSLELLRALGDALAQLKSLAGTLAGDFQSKAFIRLFATLREEFGHAYLETIQCHLENLKFKEGVRVVATLGRGNESRDFVLQKPPEQRPNWFQRVIMGKGVPSYTFHIDPRDESGARTVGELRDRGIQRAANAVAQATGHIVSFFEMLKLELAFYVGCLNLHHKLTLIGSPVSFPRPEPVGSRELQFNGLYDVSLSLTMGRMPVGNSIFADGRNMLIVTGANQGGKSVFLSSIGLAQIMMQCGMFVGAESFVGETCSGLFTHYKREEDATMKKGKLDEEISRMSGIADTIRPGAMVLFNESFAATNEREGSEIARQIVRALLERNIRVFFVTHFYDFAQSFLDRAADDVLFLRAERLPDGTRTFKLIPAAPLETSYGEDLYRRIFADRESDREPAAKPA